MEGNVASTSVKVFPLISDKNVTERRRAEMFDMKWLKRVLRVSVVDQIRKSGYKSEIRKQDEFLGAKRPELFKVVWSRGD